VPLQNPGLSHRSRPEIKTLSGKSAPKLSKSGEKALLQAQPGLLNPPWQHLLMRQPKQSVSSMKRLPPQMNLAGHDFPAENVLDHIPVVELATDR
jgi:hypothetical protein